MKKAKKFGVEVRCPCGYSLGRFDAEDDHSGIIMQCPKCKKELYISNNFIGELLESPEEYDHPDWYQAGEY